MVAIPSGPRWIDGAWASPLNAQRFSGEQSAGQYMVNSAAELVFSDDDGQQAMWISTCPQVEDHDSTLAARRCAP
jgi:hypothetical protein